MCVVNPKCSTLPGHSAILPRLTAAEFVDVAVGRAEVAPSLAPLVDVAAEQFHTSLLLLRHGSGEILDHKPTSGPVVKY